MYKITDKESAINSVRRLLFLKQNGRHDEEYIRCVKEYDCKNDTVDFETFKKIKSAYHKQLITKKIEELYPVFNKLPISFGDRGSGVELLNLMICDLIRYYKLDISRLPRGTVYSLDTENAVIILRDMFMLGSEKDTDAEFLYRLITEHKSIFLRGK